MSRRRVDISNTLPLIPPLWKLSSSFFPTLLLLCSTTFQGGLLPVEESLNVLEWHSEPSSVSEGGGGGEWFAGSHHATKWWGPNTNPDGVFSKGLIPNFFSYNFLYILCLSQRCLTEVRSPPPTTEETVENNFVVSPFSTSMRDLYTFSFHVFVHTTHVCCAGPGGCNNNNMPHCVSSGRTI